jgi:hypothetical protein
MDAEVIFSAQVWGWKWYFLLKSGVEELSSALAIGGGGGHLSNMDFFWGPEISHEGMVNIFFITCI